jgi:hypothetical protein
MNAIIKPCLIALFDEIITGQENNINRYTVVKKNNEFSFIILKKVLLINPTDSEIIKLTA